MPAELVGDTAAAAMTLPGELRRRHRGPAEERRRQPGDGHPPVQLLLRRADAPEQHLHPDHRHHPAVLEPPGVPGKKLVGKDVYVLTSSRTFSGAEEFAYNLQSQKRATIVGETTGGGAHPTRGFRVTDHFGVGVPFARSINPVTKTNWEGTGVKPDVAVPADQALHTAHLLALKKAAEKYARQGQVRRDQARDRNGAEGTGRAEGEGGREQAVASRQ